MRLESTKFQRIEAALPLIEIERELAEKRKKAGKSLLKRSIYEEFERNCRQLGAKPNTYSQKP